MFEGISEGIRKQPRQSAVEEQSFQRKEGQTALNTLVTGFSLTIIPKHKVVDWGLEGFHQVREGRPKRPKYDREEGKTKRIAQNEAVICPWVLCQFLSPSQAETWKNQAKNTAEPLELEAKMSAVHQCYRDRSRNSRPPKISRDGGGRVELAHILAVQLIYNNEESYILKFPINLKYPL